MIKRHLKKLTRDDRGSAIVVVLVAMTFVVVLASILLYLSLVNVQMKNLDRSGKKSFYDAEGVMNEVRAQVQYVVSEAINTAYTDVLDNYYSYEDKNGDESSDDERETAFKDKFREALYTEPIKSEDESYPPLFTDENGSQYFPGTLAQMLGTVEGATISGSDPAEATEMVYHATDGKYIKLMNLVVTYETSKGFYTSVTTDIKITIPSFEGISASVTQSSVPEFTIIANGDLQGSGDVSGNAYAGSVTVSGNGDALNIDSDDFVCAGDVTAENSAKLSFSDSTSLWANGIILENGSSLILNGDAYIANDLNLHGRGASAVLRGQYFGYGDSPEHSDQSSSIIVNGIGAHLDMSGIDTLVLAGHSFVNYSDGTSMMGQSVAVKSDQLAYLVPESCLGTIKVNEKEYKLTNPFDYSECGNIDTTDLQAAVDLNKKIVNDTSLGEYGIKSNNILCTREVVGPKDTGVRLIYFVMDFPESDQANKYFADYFSEHAEDIQKYLKVYCPDIDTIDGKQVGYTLDGSASVGLSGNAYYPSEETLGLINGTGVTSLDLIVKTYTNLCVTLTRNEGGGDSGAESPYSYYVNTAELSGLGGGTRYYPEGSSRSSAQVIVSDTDVTISASDAEHVHIVITSKNATVNTMSKEFKGLIIAGGDVILNGTISADSGLVADALEALEYEVSENWFEYRYLNSDHICPPNSGGKGSADEMGWDMNALVSYDNWTKNEA